MAVLKTLKLTEIDASARQREVNEDQALAIQASIVAHGLINPITVRHVPAAKGRKYALVAGAHRLRAMELLDETEIDAIVVQADALDAVLLEIEENLFRNELSKLDRAFFVMKYREVWEDKHGKITRGGDRRSKDQVDPLLKNSANFAELGSLSPVDTLAEEASRGFSVHCAERLGLSVPAIKRASFIASNIPADLRKKLAGTPAEDNQSLLLRFASLEPELRAKAAKAMDLAEGDAVKALELLLPPVKDRSEAAKVRDRLFDTWTRTNAKTRHHFLDQVGGELVTSMFEDRERAKRLLAPHRAAIETLLFDLDNGN